MDVLDQNGKRATIRGTSIPCVYYGKPVRGKAKARSFNCPIHTNRKGYKWPASALTSAEMEILTGWRQRTGVPISELLRRAVMEMDKGRVNGNKMANRDKGGCRVPDGK